MILATVAQAGDLEPQTGIVVAGIVALSKPPSETGPFHGIVEKLLVSPSFRRRGVATALMMKLEEVASVEGRPLLVSETFPSPTFPPSKVQVNEITLAFSYRRIL